MQNTSRRLRPVHILFAAASLVAVPFAHAANPLREPLEELDRSVNRLGEKTDKLHTEVLNLGVITAWTRKRCSPSEVVTGRDVDNVLATWSNDAKQRIIDGAKARGCFSLEPGRSPP